MGANVHIKDRFNRTPLIDAIEFDHHEVQRNAQIFVYVNIRSMSCYISISIFQVIKILMQCGAHLHGSAYAIGEKMCAAAAVGNLKRLESYQLANADLSQKDFSGRTPLHFAALHNKTQVLEFLLDQNVEAKCLDKTNQSPHDLARVSGSADAAKILSPNSTPITEETSR